MNRRAIVSLIAAAAGWPFAAHGQNTGAPVVGFLNGASNELSTHLVRAFHQGLGETGYAEGRNVVFDYRSAEGRYDRLPGLAEDLVRRGVNVIAATGTPTGLPAKAATTTIPIVFVTGSDPVQQGLVVSLSRPGGNLTGATTLAVELGQKRFELIRELIPLARSVALLVNPKGPNLGPVTSDAKSGARAVGLQLELVQASAVDDLEPAIQKVVGLKAGALVIGVDTFFNSQSARLAALATKHSIASIYQYREFVAAGGLMSYGGSITDAYRVAGTYVGRILRGERPSDLPVQQSTKTELFINAKTAQALGIKIPPALLLRADEIVE